MHDGVDRGQLNDIGANQLALGKALIRAALVRNAMILATIVACTAAGFWWAQTSNGLWSLFLLVCLDGVGDGLKQKLFAAQKRPAMDQPSLSGMTGKPVA